MVIDERDRGLLLSLARQSIAAGLGCSAPSLPPATASLPAALLEPAASFVTLRRMGALRGCCGLLEPIRSLAHDVWHNAWASAFQDPRYPPLAHDELAGLGIGISILSALERIRAATEAEVAAGIEPGRHGLVLALGAQRATFLPQVWHSLPDPLRFIGELKEKAGWPQDFWSPQMEAWRYTTLSLGQDD